jgi:predicted RNase H-like HicB family nuclease
MQYVVVIEQGPKSWGAYVPDLPGCVAVGRTREEVERLIRGAIELHLEGVVEDGDPIPQPGTWTTVVEVALDRPAKGTIDHARSAVHARARGRRATQPPAVEGSAQ